MGRDLWGFGGGVLPVDIPVSLIQIGDSIVSFHTASAEAGCVEAGLLDQGTTPSPSSYPDLFWPGVEPGLVHLS